jgi:rhodanese-related sulfurtransferase
MGFRDLLPISVFRGVSAVQARSQVAAGAVLLDVSRNGQWRAAHAVGATHVPLNELADSILLLPSHRQIVTICSSGVSAATAARILADVGFTVYAVRGGLAAWEAAGGGVCRQWPGPNTFALENTAERERTATGSPS